MKRLIAVGDIHGQRKLLAELINQIQLETEDQLVFLGDYIDRGPDSRGVIEDLLDFQNVFPQTVFLRGNHEQMFLDALIDCKVIKGQRLEDLSYQWAREMMRDTNVACFKRNGGDQTLASYGVEMIKDSTDESFLWPRHIMLGDIPQAHIEFFQATKLFHEQDNFIFVHAGVNSRVDHLDAQDIHDFLWNRTLGRLIGDNRILVIGHTPCPDGEPLISENHIMLDTGAAYDRALSAMDMLNDRVWQAKPETK